MSDQDNGAEATISDQTELETLREGIDDPVVLKEQLAKEAQARRQLTARAIKAETDLKALKTQSIKAESEPITTNAPVTEDERLELRLDGYSKEEVNYIMANGGRTALQDKNSYTAIAITTRREQLKAEQAANQTGNAMGEDQYREVNFNIPKNPSFKDLKDSVAKMEQALPHAE